MDLALKIVCESKDAFIVKFAEFCFKHDNINAVKQGVFPNGAYNNSELHVILVTDTHIKLLKWDKNRIVYGEDESDVKQMFKELKAEKKGGKTPGTATGGN